MVDVRQLEAAIWSIADGRGSADDHALLQVDEPMSLRLLARLIKEAENDLASVRNLDGDEREQVVADFTTTRDSLRATEAALRPPPPPPPVRRPERNNVVPVREEDLEPAEVRLQASWSAGQVVVWAAGRGLPPESNDALATRLEAIGGPPLGWQLHPPVQLPDGQRAEALAIPMKDALGWLVAVSSGHALVVSAPA
jgi:hypothetical protein